MIPSQDEISKEAICKPRASGDDPGEETAGSATTW